MCVRKQIVSICLTHLVFWGVLALFIADNRSLMAQEEVYNLDPVVVTASSIPQSFSRVAQSFSIVTREEIETSPADSISELLEYTSGVEVRQRGGHGIQADVKIRGSSFEQTLILVDGINICDPQTGHHNMDLPVTLEDIERIEVLKGPAARTYGPNAMAGVINIITRKGDHSAVGGYVKYGDYDYYDLGAHGSLKKGDVYNRVSVSRRSSTGHIPEEETDFDIKTLTYDGKMNSGDHEFRLGLGYADKDFGAYRFYSAEFPNQRERTETLRIYGTADLKIGNLQLMPKIFWRRHDDHFEIEIGGNWYHNEHRSNAHGVQLDTQLGSEWGITAVGGEMVFEDLQSSNLGDHHRQRSGLFFEHQFYPSERLIFGLGTSAIYYGDWGWGYWPGAEFNMEFREGVNVFASSARSFRIPTYTELFYYTPANQGNPDLKPERAWTHEIGMRCHKPGIGTNFSLFLRDETDVIDWSRFSNQDPWKAGNLAEIRTKGFELGLDFYPDAFLNTGLVSTVHIAYTYLKSDRDMGGMDSKYALDHLRHQLQSSLVFTWFDNLKYVLQAKYEERIAGDSAVIVETRLAYSWRQYEAFIEVTNLFDEQYVDAGFAPMPGRWVKGGIRFNMEFK